MEDVHAEIPGKEGLCLLGQDNVARFSEGPREAEPLAREFHTGGRMPSALRFGKHRVERHESRVGQKPSRWTKGDGEKERKKLAEDTGIGGEGW